jgi:hypothetical protein
MNDAKKRVVVLFQYGWFLAAPLGVGDAGELRKSGEPHADTKHKKNCVPERATYMLGRGQNVTAHVSSASALICYDVWLASKFRELEIPRCGCPVTNGNE